MHLNESELETAVGHAQARIDNGDATHADMALMDYHAAVKEFVLHMENQDRALELYRNNSQVPAETLKQLGKLQELQKAHAAALAEIHSLKTYLGQRASSNRWEVLKKQYSIRYGRPVDDEIAEFVETCLAEILRERV